jgi:ATP-dependent helicase/nuclease subunit B
LSTFAACPYQYFARYILELKERKEFKFEPLDLGAFYHRVLDGLLKKLNAEKKDFASVDDEHLRRLLRGQIEEFVTEDSFISNFARHSLHNAFVIHSAGEVLEDCVRAIAQMVRAGSFRPSWSEVSFGQVRDALDNLGEYKISLSNGRVLSLDGKIDRLDIANADRKKIAAVFDYKRRSKSFSWSEFHYGLDMQLPIYMLAVRSASEPQYKVQEVAGAFYMPVEVNPKRNAVDELPSKMESFDYKAKGLFNGAFAQQLDEVTKSDWSKFYNFRVTKKDEQYGDYARSGALKPGDFDKILRFTERKVVALTEEILAGKIVVNPYRLGTQSPCSYCKYKSVCRFDWQMNDYNLLGGMSKIAVLRKIEAADG